MNDIVLFGDSVLCSIETESSKSSIVLSPSAENSVRESSHLVVVKTGPDASVLLEGDTLIVNSQFIDKAWIDTTHVIIHMKDVIACRRK